jgi:hypothetical protein
VEGWQRTYLLVFLSKKFIIYNLPMPFSKNQIDPAISQTEKTLALSEFHILLEALEEEHEWLLKQIKRKRTELKNFVDKMRSVATQAFHQVTPVLQNLMALDREIHSLFQEIFTARRMGRQTRLYVMEIYHHLQIAGMISPKSLDGDEADSPELDELFENPEATADFFQDFSSRPGEEQQGFAQDFSAPVIRREESKKIRQTFLRLAEIFHPDRVTDSETQMRHTEIMKEINRAYQEGDLARLLEIEQQHSAGEIIDGNSESDLSRRCQKLKQHNEFLKDQYENLKRELRLAKNTPEGAMVADYRKAVKEGIDPIEQMLTAAEQQREIVEEIRNFVKNFRDKKVTVKHFLQGPECLRNMRRSAMEDLLEEMFGVSVTRI